MGRARKCDKREDWLEERTVGYHVVAKGWQMFWQSVVLSLSGIIDLYSVLSSAFSRDLFRCVFSVAIPLGNFQ